MLGKKKSDAADAADAADADAADAADADAAELPTRSKAKADLAEARKREADLETELAKAKKATRAAARRRAEAEKGPETRRYSVKLVEDAPVPAPPEPRFRPGSFEVQLTGRWNPGHRGLAVEVYSLMKKAMDELAAQGQSWVNSCVLTRNVRCMLSDAATKEMRRKGKGPANELHHYVTDACKTGRLYKRAVPRTVTRDGGTK